MDVSTTISAKNLSNHSHETNTQTYSPWNQTRTGASVSEGNSTTTKVIMDSMLFFIIFLAISGNLLVCIAVFTDHRLKVHHCNFLLVSLAVADMLVSTAVMPFAIFNDIHGRWIFGAVFCNIWISCDIMCSTASILNLCVIALDRWKHIRDPLHYEQWMTTSKLVVMIAAVWIVSALLAIVPLRLGWHEQPGRTSAELLAKLGVCILLLNPTYAIVSSSISFYIPCVIMVSVYISIFNQAHHQVKSTVGVRRQADSLQTRHRRFHFSYQWSNLKAAITLGIIMGAFLLCWLPFFIINPIAAVCPPCIPNEMFQTFTWFGYVNSCLNPFIYSVFNTDFRRAFSRVLSCQKPFKLRNVKIFSGTRSHFRSISAFPSSVEISRESSRNRLFSGERVARIASSS